MTNPLNAGAHSRIRAPATEPASETAVRDTAVMVTASQEPDPAATPEAADAATQPDADEFDMATALVRLVVGMTLEGMDELTARLREWDGAMRAATRAPTQLPALRATPADPRRSVMVGLVFEMQARLRGGLATMIRRTEEAARTVAEQVAPALHLTPFDPVMEELFAVYRAWTEHVEHLAVRGSAEEQAARLMARKALPGVLDRVLDVATKNPEVRALLQQQGAEVAKSALDEARERVGTADALAERIAHTLLRRPKPLDTQTPPKPRNGPGAHDANGADGASHAPGAP